MVCVGRKSGLFFLFFPLQFGLHAREEKNMSISTDFGKISHVQTDLFEVLHTHRIKVWIYTVYLWERKGGSLLKDKETEWVEIIMFSFLLIGGHSGSQAMFSLHFHSPLPHPLPLSLCSIPPSLGQHRPPSHPRGSQERQHPLCHFHSL